MKNNDFKNFLKDEANALVVQKHQLQNSQNKLGQINQTIDEIKNMQSKNDEMLVQADILANEMRSNLNLSSNNSFATNEIILDEILQNELEVTNINTTKIQHLESLETIDFKDDMSWNDYKKSIESYGTKHHLKLSEDPFKKLMSVSQQIEFQKRIKEEFTYKNAKCDKYDYMIAGTCGVIGGLIDILFVGAPGDSKLGNFTDNMADKATEKFAECLGWDRNKAITKGSDTTKSAIGFLEKKFKVNYDQATTRGKNGTDGMVSNLSPKNHHLKSLAHSPDLIGLFFSILNQFTSTSSFISNGEIITIDTEIFELQGNNFIAKIFSGFVNWFGHLASDWTGSSGASERGSGIPIPFYNLFQLCNFGSFGKDRQTFAQITTKVFENGYDFRHGLTMAIPVIITELLIRFMYSMKARFYHKKEWKKCIPNENIPELRRMLVVGHSALCLIDGADAYMRSGGEMVTMLSRTNLIAWIRFAAIAHKEIKALWLSGKMDIDKVDEYLDNSTIEMYSKIALR